MISDIQMITFPLSLNVFQFITNYSQIVNTSLIGFAENRDGKTCAVLRQPFILSQREATQQEINEEMEQLGFRKEQDEGYFTNSNYDIFDAVPNNVLKGEDGHLYFIDTIIFKSGTGGYDTYHSLSPRASK